MGSSPRMRGAPRDEASERLAVGIIPAYAGSTSSSTATIWSGRDHPRVCGEHRFSLSERRPTAGSSPRMRGARLLGERPERLAGIIPAYAGSTWPRGSCPYRPRDHPRVCGEHVMPSWAPSASAGSSPRMRGARRNRNGIQATEGIIPAYAGSTTCTWPARLSSWDHPRVCGEHVTNRSAYGAIVGSSPRMRGALGT